MSVKKILLIIPAYNEETNILKTYAKCITDEKKWDVIVINDGSTDRTLKICLENDIPYINLIHNVGIGGAVQTGYKYAYEQGYDVAIQFDGDGQHNVEYLDRILEPLERKEADLVIGSRFIDKYIEGFKSSASRRIGIKIISKLIQICTGERITDPTSGFRAANRSVIKKFAKSYPIEYPEPDSIVTLLKDGYTVKEAPVVMNERVGGKSSIHSWKNGYYMINVCLSILLTSISQGGHEQ